MVLLRAKKQIVFNGKSDLTQTNVQNSDMVSKNSSNMHSYLHTPNSVFIYMHTRNIKWAQKTT